MTSNNLDKVINTNRSNTTRQAIQVQEAGAVSMTNCPTVRRPMIFVHSRTDDRPVRLSVVLIEIVPCTSIPRVLVPVSGLGAGRSASGPLSQWAPASQGVKVQKVS